MKIKIRNIEKAAGRIKQAIHNNEKIILYGDSDLDGITSVVMLEEAIKNLGGTVSDTFFPDRENDGYGVNLKALEILKTKAPALFVTLDLGIANNKEIAIANEIGLKVIVVDHHEVLHSVPDAEIVVDPKQPGDDSGFKYLANVGLTFKLCEELLGQNMSVNLKKSFLELTALATISDMVPQIDDNKIYIEEGLRSLKNTWRPGLRSFLDILGEGEVLANGFYKVISALNAGETLNFKNESYVLLTSSSRDTCMEITQDLIAKTNYKQIKIKAICEEVERRASQKSGEPIIFEGDPAWKLLLAGSVASIIHSKYNKPTFIYKKGDTEACGSVRSPKGTNSVEAMKSCGELLLTYGGHAQASGFRLKNENLEKFKEGLVKYFTENPIP